MMLEGEIYTKVDLIYLLVFLAFFFSWEEAKQQVYA